MASEAMKKLDQDVATSSAVLIGISGASRSGKSSLAFRLQSVLHPRVVTLVQQDEDRFWRHSALLAAAAGSKWGNLEIGKCLRPWTTPLSPWLSLRRWQSRMLPLSYVRASRLFTTRYSWRRWRFACGSMCLRARLALGAWPHHRCLRLTLKNASGRAIASTARVCYHHQACCTATVAPRWATLQHSSLPKIATCRAAVLHLCVWTVRQRLMMCLRRRSRMCIAHWARHDYSCASSSLSLACLSSGGNQC